MTQMISTRHHDGHNCDAAQAHWQAVTITPDPDNDHEGDFYTPINTQSLRPPALIAPQWES
jgi:hypothetical protein